MRLERAFVNRGPLRLPHLIALVLVPVILAGGFLWSLGRQATDLERVTAAVVNLDEPVKVNGQITPMGRQLTAELVSGPQTGNITWVLSDEQDAAEGLESGEYAVVVTIPKDFSERATSFGGEASQAQRARIDVQTSPMSPIGDTVISEAVTAASTRAFNQWLTENYLDQIYLGFNTMGEQFDELATGTRKLADGAGQLSDGVEQASDGTLELSQGLLQLVTAGAQLAAGGQELSTGAQSLSAGLQTMHQQTSGLPGQTRQLADGAGRLSHGVDQLNAQMPQLTSGTHQLADGSQQFATGVEQYATGVQQLTGEMLPLVDGLSAALDKVTMPTEEQLAQYLQQARQISAAAGQLGDSITEFHQKLTALAQNGAPVPTVPCPPELEQVPGGCEAFQAGFEQGWTNGTQQVAAAILPMFETPDPATGLTLVEMAGQLSAISQEVDALLTEYSDQLDQLPAGLSGLQSQLEELSSGLRQLHDNSPAIISGAKELSTGASKLADGTDRLASGVDQLSGGARQLADGTDQFAAGMTQLSSGIAAAADGAVQLTAGVDQYTSGVTQYVDGVSQAASGAVALSDGMLRLNDGAAELADGTQELADGIAANKDDIPQYSDADRENLKSVVSQPVSESGITLNVLPAWVAFVLGLMLWLGAMATYLLVRAVPADTLVSNRPSWRLSFASITPAAAIAAVQAVALTVLSRLVLDIAWSGILTLLVVLTIVGVSYALVNHALVAWFGGVGRLVSVVLISLVVGSSLAGTAPGFFASIRGVLPPAPGIDAIQAALTGSPVIGHLVGVIGWGVVAAVASWVAVLRNRSVGLEDYLRALKFS